MTSIDWNILRGAPDAGAAFQQGYAQSRQRSAMGALARDPSNQDALAALYETNPDAAVRMESVGRDRTKWQQDQTALAAQRAYVTSRYGGGATPNALATPMQSVNPAPGPTPYETPRTTLDVLASNGGTQPTPRVSMAPPAAAAAPAADSAWLAYAQADPAGAMKARQEETEWQSKRMKLTKDDLEAHQAVNDHAMRLLNGVTDQPTYDRAVADAHALYDQYGYEMPELPAVYDPHIVDALRNRALEVKDVIAADLAERKFDWQKQDDRVDNARDDRRVAISDRSERDSSARGWRADRRAQVRFGERALDRAALAGVRTDTSDLDY